VIRRRELALFVVPMVALSIAANVGNALAPSLLTEQPALLLALAPKTRWLLLSSPNLHAVAFYGIPLVRALAVMTLYYCFGRRYGDAALQWVEARVGRSMRPVRWIERQFHRARYLIVFAFPGSLVALLGGADEMSFAGFLVVAMVATAVRLVLIRTVAGLFADPLLDVLDWIADHQLWLTVGSVVAVVGYVLWTNRSSPTPIKSVETIAGELDVAAAKVADEPDPA
jgi:membrane protein DedA with SNARE-associated domain